MKTTRINKKRILIYIFMFLPILITGITINSDAWFLLNGGRYILNNGFPYIEPFTIHTGLNYVMQQWMTSVIFYKIYSIAGTIGLITLVYIIFIIIIVSIYKLCMIVSKNNFLVSVVSTFVSAIYISFQMTTRPQIFTILILVLEVLVLEKYINSNKWQELIWLPIISVFFINVHAAMWFMQFIVLLPYIIDSYNLDLKVIKGQGYPKKPLFITALFMFLGGFVNPYGIKSITYVFGSYGIEEINDYVKEMHPLNITQSVGLFLFLLFFIIIASFILYKKGTMRLRYVLLMLGFGYMSLLTVRNMFLFSSCAVFGMAYYFKDLQLSTYVVANISKPLKSGSSKLFRIIVSVLMIAVLCFGIFYKVTTIDNSIVQKDAVDYILKNCNVDTVKMYTSYNDGAYAEYMGIKCYMDARAEVFLKSKNGKEDIFYEYCRLLDGKIYYKDFLQKYKFTHIMVTSDDILYVLLAHDKDYEIVYEDNYCKIYAPAN
ncbi:MAG: hypothetical protein ACI4DS_08105 [Eubacterium sp.]